MFRQHRRRCARHAARAGLCFSGAGWADYARLRGALKMISERLDVAGFDLVEINPLLDVPTGATAYLGAHGH